MSEARPIVKWVGGKGQLLDRLQPLFPPKFNRYIEPFAGAGAVFFRLHNLGLIGANPRLRRTPAILNDLNAELMNVYQAVRDHIDEVLDELARHQAHAIDPDYYYFIRSLDREPDFAQQPVAVRAARSIYLNKTNYNGLYRVNKDGFFNAPFGRHKKPNVLDRPTLLAAHRALQRVDLMCADFAQPLRLARTSDFIYIDPPYQPVSATSNFVSYTSDGFGWSEQERFATWVARLINRGCYVLINNADTPEVRQLYQSAFESRRINLNLQSFTTARNINSRVTQRSGTLELAIWNY
jgi:DNA adenine methylase